MKIANVSTQKYNASPSFGKVYNTLTTCGLVAEKAADPNFRKAYLDFDSASKELFEVNEYGDNGLAIRGIDSVTEKYTDFLVKNAESATAALISATKRIAQESAPKEKVVRQIFPGKNSAKALDVKG